MILPQPFHIRQVSLHQGIHILSYTRKRLKIQTQRTTSQRLTQRSSQSTSASNSNSFTQTPASGRTCRDIARAPAGEVADVLAAETGVR